MIAQAARISELESMNQLLESKLEVKEIALNKLRVELIERAKSDLLRFEVSATVDWAARYAEYMSEVST